MTDKPTVGIEKYIFGVELWKQHKVLEEEPTMEVRESKKKKKTNLDLQREIEREKLIREKNFYPLYRPNTLLTGETGKMLEVIVLAHGESDVEEAIKILRKMLDTYKRRKWDPR